MPKRTHANPHYAHSSLSTTTTKSTPIEFTKINSTGDGDSGNSTNSKVQNENVYKNQSDIKIIHRISPTNKSLSENEIPPIVEIHHHRVKQRKPLIKKTKYQDFDASLVNDDGIFSSIMKVFGLNQCPLTPPDQYGPIEADATFEELDIVEKRFAGKIQPGGRFWPSECRARDRVAVVIPYRDRKQHIPIFLKNIHNFLMKQQIDYGIFIVEQSAEGNFNRAKLMNVGFTEALKTNEWDCFVFHDIDLLPLDDRNLYNCPDQPRHMSVAVDTLGFKLPYSSIFGGVSSMTTKQFQAVNGFSNSFWGW